MRYINKEGKTLNLDEAMAATSFLIESDVYIQEPMEMYFNKEGDLRAGKKPQVAVKTSA